MEIKGVLAAIFELSMIGSEGPRERTLSQVSEMIEELSTTVGERLAEMTSSALMGGSNNILSSCLLLRRSDCAWLIHYIHLQCSPMAGLHLL